MKANPMARSVAMSRRLLKFGGGSVTTTRPDDPLDYECATVITTFPFLCPCSTYLKASAICSNG